MASLIRRTLIEGDIDELATRWSPILAGAIFGVAVSVLADASAVAGIKPPVLLLVPPLFALFSLVVLAVIPRQYLASLDDGGGSVFGGASEGGLSPSVRAKILLFFAYASAFGSAAGGVALAAGAGSHSGSGGAVDDGGDKRAKVASGSLSCTVLTLVAGMVLWFGRGSHDDFYSGYYGY